MSHKERDRLDVMSRISRGEVELAEGAVMLNVSYRQVRRIRKSFLERSDAGLVHKLRGRASNRKTKVAVREAVLKLYREKYAGFGPTLACEYLAREGYVQSHDTLLRWLRVEKLFEKRRKRSKHRSRRERRLRQGQMVQMDGSRHDWFEGRGPWCCLMVMVDDATGWTYARFYEQETTEGVFDMLGLYISLKGLPRSLYVDRHSIYRGDEGQLTQVGRALVELEVELIMAHSPQAKGRVERKNGVFQDRLVKEMRLRGICTIQAANVLLEESFLEELNEKFCVKAVERWDAHRKVAGGVDLSEVLCVCEERKVGQDWCVQWRGRVLQLDKSHERLELAGKRAKVRQKLDGTLQVVWQEQKLKHREVPRRPEKVREKKVIVNNRKWKPPEDHPWKGKGPAARPSSATPPQPLPPE